MGVYVCFKNNIIEKNVVQTNRKNAVGFLFLHLLASVAYEDAAKPLWNKNFNEIYLCALKM